MNTTDNRRTERREIEDLLPWYVTDTLERADHDRVADYIRQHPEISSQLDLVRDELDETVNINERLGAPSPGALDRMMSAIEADPGYRAIARKAGQGLWQKLDEFLDALTPDTRRFAAITAALLIFAQAVTLGVIYSRDVSPGATYETATRSPGPAAQGTFAIVKFSDGATSGAINSLLAGLRVTIVDGPKPGGAYRVRLSSNKLSPEEQVAIFKKLRSNKAVIVFAEPAR